MTRIFFFLTGFALMVIGFSFIILYLNLLTIGYNFNFYVNFITRRIECYYAIIGFIIVLLTIIIKGDKKHELHL
ncbi:MAG: hypothetical protein MR598_07430 [Erysipelotrichaceae bacterium]|nr:hypothetical protein [Erysipelotrichaceae bacterium]